MTSLLDAPSGDAGWIMRAALDIDYVGVDIVQALVEALDARAEAGEITGRFLCMDVTIDPRPRCDAVLCRNCLVHLSFANISKAVRNFARSGAAFLITTTFTDWQANRDCEDGDWRALNLERPPFNWGEPLFVLNE